MFYGKWDVLLLWSSLPIEGSNNSVIFPEEMGWFIIGFLLLDFGIVGHVCQTQDWFIIMWKFCSILEMKDGKDPLRASQYCKIWLASSGLHMALSAYSDSGTPPAPCPRHFVPSSPTSGDCELPGTQPLSRPSEQRKFSVELGTMSKNK